MAANLPKKLPEAQVVVTPFASLMFDSLTNPSLTNGPPQFCKSRIVSVVLIDPGQSWAIMA